MPSLKERAKRVLFRDDYEQIQEAYDYVNDLMRRRPWLVDDAQREQFAEFDSRSVWNLYRHRNDYLLSAGGSAVTSDERKTWIEDSRTLFKRSANARAMVRTWTNFGFGQTVEVDVRLASLAPVTAERQRAALARERERLELVERQWGVKAWHKAKDRLLEAADNDPATAWWTEFWHASRNRPVIGEKQLYDLSNKLLVDGEFLFVLYTFKSGEDAGLCTVRTLPADEITEIVTSPDDPAVPLFYKRQYTDHTGSQQTRYYPDWLHDTSGQDWADEPHILDPGMEARPSWWPPDDQRADLEREDIDVVAIHVPFELIEGRGQPLLATCSYWIKEYADFSEDLMAIAASNAAFGRKIKLQGGSRARKAIQARLESALTSTSADRETNPPPSAASAWLENEAMSAEEMPISRAGTVASETSNIAAANMAIGAGFYPHWLGRGEAFRLATATAMEVPTLRLFARYQQFWRSVWADLVNAVLDKGEQYGGLQAPREDRDVDVSTDALLDADLGELASAVEAFGPYLPPEVVRRVALEALNVPNIDDVLEQYEEESEAGWDQFRQDLVALREYLGEIAGGDGDEETRVVAGAASAAIGRLVRDGEGDESIRQSDGDGRDP